MTQKKLSARETLKRLSKIAVIRTLPPEEIAAIVPLVSRRRLRRGAHLIREGESGDALYFIEKGTAAVRRKGSGKKWLVGAGEVVGETALLTGEPRSATVAAASDLSLWRIEARAFRELLAGSPKLKKTLERLVELRRQGPVPAPSAAVWTASALRALEARTRGLKAWQYIMGMGMLFWAALFLNEHHAIVDPGGAPLLAAGLQLLCGLFILQGSCEALIDAAERLGAREKWDGFISGTIGSILSTLPEFVVIAFLIRVDPLAAYVTAIVTIFNNAVAFSIYAFFLPKDRQGTYTMPRSVTMAGGEILIAGAGISLTVGFVMLVMRINGLRSALRGWDLLSVGSILIAIYAYYVVTLVRYYGEGEDDQDSHPPDPERLGHDIGLSGIAWMFVVGIAGAYCGGESIGSFAEIAINRMHMATIPTAAALAFFAGISEYIIVYKSHRRGELGIALSNVFGGMTQVMFLLLPFGLIVIGGLGLLGFGEQYVVALNAPTMFLTLLLFPLFYTLHQYLEQEKRLSNLGAAGMTGLYLLLLFFLFTASA